MIVRARLSQPLTPTQELVAELVVAGKTADEIAERMGIKATTARFHIRSIASKIPGSLPAKGRIVTWWRGASLAVLSGEGVVIR